MISNTCLKGKVTKIFEIAPPFSLQNAERLKINFANPNKSCNFANQSEQDAMTEQEIMKLEEKVYLLLLLQ